MYVCVSVCVSARVWEGECVLVCVYVCVFVCGCVDVCGCPTIQWLIDRESKKVIMILYFFVQHFLSVRSALKGNWILNVNVYS